MMNVQKIAKQNFQMNLYPDKCASLPLQQLADLHSVPIFVPSFRKV